MPKNTWWIASLLTALVLMGLAALYAKQQKVELEKARGELEAIRKNAEETNAQAERLLLGLEESKDRIETLLKEKEEVTQAQRNLESQMRSALESKDVTISQLQGRLTVDILDRILFDSGEAVLKPDGQAVLDQIAKVLAEFPTRQVQVIGHTDNVPIRVNPMNPFATNWELSAGRAIAAVRYLVEKAGVDPRRLSAVGYGEHHPIADNATPEGRARNRRIAIVIAPEELVPTDIVHETISTNVAAEAMAPSTNLAAEAAAPSTNAPPQEAKNEPKAEEAPKSDAAP